MSKSVSVEQLDAMIEEEERAMEETQNKIVALKSVRTMLFGADDGQPSPAGVVGGGSVNCCTKCQHRWPKSRGRQARACPKCGEEWRE